MTRYRDNLVEIDGFFFSTVSFSDVQVLAAGPLLVSPL
jgi:hypothetical protein